MAITLVQASSNDASSTSTTLTVNNGSGAIQAGDLIIAATGAKWTAGLTVTMSDSTNGAYASAIGPTVESSFPLFEQIFFFQNSAAVSIGVNTLTVTYSLASDFIELRMLVFRGVLATGNPVHKISGATNFGVPPIDSGAVTTTVAGCLLYAGYFGSSSGITPGSGWTGISTIADEYIPDAAAGTYNGIFGATTVDRWISNLVAFLPASGGVSQTGQAILGPKSAMATSAVVKKIANSPIGSRGFLNATAKHTANASVVI